MYRVHITTLAVSLGGHAFRYLCLHAMLVWRYILDMSDIYGPGRAATVPQRRMLSVIRNYFVIQTVHGSKK